LSAALAYPLPEERFDDSAIVRALLQVGLTRYLDERQVARAWSRSLSPGEQQRLQFARVLLHRPDWVFLDEASSALDEPAEQAMYECLRSQLPNTTVVSVGHRSTLRRLHDVEWQLEPQTEAAPPALHAKQGPDEVKRFEDPAQASLTAAGEPPATTKEQVHGVREIPERQRPKRWAIFGVD
jgi:ABC-type uncharacterized transport system fused permease/ATPase subunit